MIFLTKVKAGRKPKYTDEFLIKCIEKYKEAHPFEQKITASKVGNYSGVPHYIFRDNPTTKVLLKSLNSTTTLSETTRVKELILPSANEIVATHYGNKKRLTQNIQALLDLVVEYQTDFDKMMNLSKIETEYKEKIQELESENKHLKNKIESLEDEIDLMYLESESTTKRREKGLVKNFISFEEANPKAFSKNVDDLGNEFNLFDDFENE